MDDKLRVKYLFEYQLRNGSSHFPSFEEYKAKQIQTLEEDKPEEPVSEPAPDGGTSIPEPEEEAPAQDAPQPANANDGGEAPAEPVANQEVPPVSNAPAEPAPAPEQDDTEEILQQLNDKIANQEGTLQKILKFLSPEPEPTPEEKINSKLDALTKEVSDLKNADKLKRDKIKNLTPFNMSLQQMWDATEEKEEKEMSISQSDIDNYDPSYIKKTLGIPDQLREGKE